MDEPGSDEFADGFREEEEAEEEGEPSPVDAGIASI